MKAEDQVRSLNEAGETALVITGIDDEADDVFGSTLGYWNVSKAVRDCAAGLHGEPFDIETRPAIRANETIEVDPKKIAAFFREGRTDDPPLIAVIFNGRSHLIDGHHRLRSLALHQRETFRCYVIEEDKERDYRVRFLEKAPGRIIRELPPGEIERRREEAEKKAAEAAVGALVASAGVPSTPQHGFEELRPIEAYTGKPKPKPPLRGKPRGKRGAGRG